MIIEISDEIANQCRLNPQEALQLLAIAIYRVKGVNGALAAQIMGVSEFEFHQLLKQGTQTHDFGVDDLVADIKQHLAGRKQSEADEKAGDDNAN